MPEFKKLLDGYRRFRRGPYKEQRVRYDDLAIHGQNPGLMVISCCDSRVDPAQIFDVSPGEIFVLRNVANLVPPFEEGGGQHGVSAALEFAVTQLKVHYIVVMGHAACGGVKASLTHNFEGAEIGKGHFIGNWMDLLKEPRDRIEALKANNPDIDAQRALELAAVRTSLRNLRTFPFVKEAEAQGKLILEGTYFGIAEGILYRLDGRDDQFKPLDPEES